MKLRMIPTSVHSAIDHAVAPTLIASPEILRLSKTSPEGLVAEVTGGLAAIYSNLTDYELSVKNVIPMKVHLALDALSGAALAIVPHATGARKRGITHWLPQTAIGAFEVGMALLTKPEPPRSKPARAFSVVRAKAKLTKAKLPLLA